MPSTGYVRDLVITVSIGSISSSFSRMFRTTALRCSMMDIVVNYTESHTYEDLRPLIVTILTIIFCQFAHLYNVNKSYGFSRYIKSKNEKCYIEVHFIHQRRHPDGCLHGRPDRQDWRLRCPSP